MIYLEGAFTLLRQDSGMTGLEKGSRFAFQVGSPSGPFLLFQITERRVSTLVFHVQQVGALGQDEIDQLKIGGVSPASIVKRRTTIIVADGKGHRCLFDQKGSDFHHAFAACHVK